MRFALLSILLLPFVEIAGFVIVGRAIGVLPVLALTLLGTVVGLLMLRVQGAETLRRLAAESRAGRDAGRSLVHAALIVVAAFLLIVPGFVTDLLGLLLFIPPLRDLAWSLARPRIVVVRSGGFTHQARPASPESHDHQQNKPAQVIDLPPEDYERRDER